MKITNIFFICFLGFWLTPSVMTATHIVGGDMTYRFIERQGENNRYLFTLKIYYDCFPADNMPIDTDSSIMIGIYQRMTASPELWRLTGTSNFSRMLTVRRKPVSYIPNPVLECREPESRICVYEGIFEFEVILKRINAPYFISYQRCCRNQTITNLIQGGSAGSNYHVLLTPESQAANNSSPTFNNYPSTLICFGDQLVYNHAATDPEGDRLVYKFCRVLSSPGPRSRPGCYQSPDNANNNCPPPLEYANYYAQYPFDKPMAGDPLIKLDSLTGMIRGTPNSIGQFVVSVCVEEYRNGVLLGTVFRDFQFNVVRCPKKVETFIFQADSVSRTQGKRFIISKCDSTTITIVNNSQQLRYVNSFYWEFNINGSTRRFTNWHPTITFPDTGLYRGMLWINRGEVCYDSAYVDVMIGSGFKTKFEVNFDSCNVSPITFTNRTSQAYFGIRAMRWDLGDTLLLGRIIPSVTHQYRTAGIKQVRLTLTNIFGCIDDTLHTFEYLPMPNQIDITANPRNGCVNTAVQFQNLTSIIDSSYQIKWDFGDGQTTTALNPRHIYTSSGNFAPSLMVRNQKGCQRQALLRGGISISTTPRANFDFEPQEINVTTGEVNFLNRSSVDALRWNWQFGNLGSSALKDPSFSFRDTGWVNVRLKAFNAYGCTDSITKKIFIEPFIIYYLPNAFTPNEDGINDVFVGKGYLGSFKSFNMQIYDRWGSVIFETNSPTEGWTGQRNNVGLLLPEGNYLCVVRYQDYKGKETIVKDFIKLIR